MNVSQKERFTAVYTEMCALKEQPLVENVVRNAKKCVMGDALGYIKVWFVEAHLVAEVALWEEPKDAGWRVEVTNRDDGEDTKTPFEAGAFDDAVEAFRAAVEAALKVT